MTIDLNERLRRAAADETADVRLVHPADLGGEVDDPEPRHRPVGAWVAGALVAAAAVVLLTLVVTGGSDRVRTLPSDVAPADGSPSGADAVAPATPESSAPLQERALMGLRSLEREAWSAQTTSTFRFDDGADDDVAVGNVRFNPPSRYQIYTPGVPNGLIIRDGASSFVQQADGRWEAGPAGDDRSAWVGHLLEAARATRCWSGLSGRDGVVGWAPADGVECGEAPAEPKVVVVWDGDDLEEVALTEAGAMAPSGRTGMLTTSYRFEYFGDRAPVVTIPSSDMLGADPDVPTTTAALAAPPTIGSRLPHLPGPLSEVGQSDRPMLLVVAATWCPHCQRPIGDLRQLAQDGAIPGGVDVVVISTYIGRSSEHADLFDELPGLGVPVVVDTPIEVGGPGAMTLALGATSLPTIIAVSPDGTVVDIAEGEERPIADLLAAAAASA